MVTSDIELEDIKLEPENNNDAGGSINEVSTDNGTLSRSPTQDGPSEDRPFLEDNQRSDRSDPEVCRSPKRQNEKRKRMLGTLKSSLNKPVWKLKVWMILIFLMIFIAFIILISIIICKAPREDVDEKYNSEEFVVSRCFRGNYTLSNTQADPIVYLQEKLTQIFSSSYALGRYFSLATIHPISNNTMEYELKFQMPEQQENLTEFTLSKEFVYSVLLQTLSDQETGDHFYMMPPARCTNVGTESR